MYVLSISEWFPHSVLFNIYAWCSFILTTTEVKGSCSDMTVHEMWDWGNDMGLWTTASLVYDTHTVSRIYESAARSLAPKPKRTNSPRGCEFFKTNTVGQDSPISSCVHSVQLFTLDFILSYFCCNLLLFKNNTNRKNYLTLPSSLMACLSHIRRFIRLYISDFTRIVDILCFYGMKYHRVGLNFTLVHKYISLTPLCRPLFHLA